MSSMAKILITIDDELLEQLDAHARSGGSSRSKIAAEGIRAVVARPNPHAVSRRRASLAAARALIAAAPDDGIDTTEWLRREREARLEQLGGS